ncbi:hypothetical protein RZP91_03410 [Citrobacter freundii]|uniref:hypothetical protein n=1 Tax=Citrobacter freundii TaxID=546 RepID=UPI0015E54F34|nr:hypothetical protein [Citrobacter freundii]MDV1293592.1 hypothetical protein [Citrobacter freundii]MEB0335767.1 hypothetical protein [Citrobacter freundii]QLN53053.1 hypothetical protein HV060_07650 [Citrobacter freundii]QLN62740.1 hypothetical protein HV074_07665 [Citrobacter freundii]QLO71989.1 hypothetical protein HV304_07660 [Citrobacter freundii]
MSFKSGVTTRVDNAQAILDSLRSLTKKDVLVGIPSEDSEREDVPFGNAGIGYVNEYGSPAQNIPPRPHLIPGVKSVEEQTMPQLKAAAQAALDGNAAGAERALNRAGTLAANGVRRYMTITGFTPLADSTVEARARRGRKGAKAELARRSSDGKLNAINPDSGQLISNENVRPLIDTGQYRRAITHVVRDKDADS